jgi:hypothetical protein
MLVWEVAYMPAWLVRLRVVLSLPFPVIVGALAMMVSGVGK